ncbi:hypothetical protein C8E95_6692 [Pseudonocardia autotrophica]|uniref:Uncharacterized protein n=1 Tax=Pseudonocardia autotrophica TaxID=2074 RepID=A0A1Y2N7I6_PSEAH|nr:hypothetical protein BG845_01110 [Pseudonocardia autotrophica]TDN77446.1 hypothetical protein C8E95_6692 [Pseudonocardia autotrophica]
MHDEPQTAPIAAGGPLARRGAGPVPHPVPPPAAPREHPVRTPRSGAGAR